MNPFQYVTAHTSDEAVSLIGQNGRYLGGGIDLLGEMKDYIVSPDVLVDVKGLSDLTKIHSEYEGTLQMSPAWPESKKSPPALLYIGSLVTITELAENADIKTKLPGLSEAATEVGSPQIRNVASLAGNLLQHSRCWYYRQPDIACLKRSGDTCYAQEGENKYHSLFTGCKCITPFTSNLGVMLAALDGMVYVQKGPKSFAHLSIPELYSEAWKNPAAHTSLKTSDFLCLILVNLNRARSAYRQMSEKSEFDWALVSCAAAGNVADGKITDARIALGAVAPVPYMVKEAHHFLEGKSLTDENASKAADIILKDAKPLAHNGYKIPLAHTLIRRTLLALNT